MSFLLSWYLEWGERVLNWLNPVYCLVMLASALLVGIVIAIVG